MEQHARDSLALLDLLQPEPAVVCGLSMGGYCALALHRLAAERVRALVLCDTKAEPDSDEARRQRAAQALAVGERGPEELVRPMIQRLLSPLTRSERPDVVAGLEAMMNDVPPETLIAALRALAARRTRGRSSLASGFRPWSSGRAGRDHAGGRAAGAGGRDSRSAPTAARCR
jgi:pimeloyl-ACP methyl ester carboxylesterase